MRGKSRFSLLKNRDFRLNANPLIESSLTSAIADGVNGAISGCWWREWRCQWTLIALSANADGAIGAVSGRWWRCQQTLMAWLALSADADGAVCRRWWHCQQTLIALIARIALSTDADGANGAVSGCWWREWRTPSAPSAPSAVAVSDPSSQQGKLHMLGRGSNGKSKLGRTNQRMDGAMFGPVDGPTDPWTDQ